MNLIRINRIGKAETSQCSSVQCKHTNHGHYGYQVSISCHEGNRDESGWIVDNREIQAMVDKVFTEHGGKSCEDIVCAIATASSDLAKSHNVLVHDVYVKIWPRKEREDETHDPESYAWFEYSLSGNFTT